VAKATPHSSSKWKWFYPASKVLSSKQGFIQQARFYPADAERSQFLTAS
jgi:hypothetical protein